MKRDVFGKRHSISRSLQIVTILSILLVCDIVGIHGFITYRREIMNRYRNELENLLYFVALSHQTEDPAELGKR